MAAFTTPLTLDEAIRAGQMTAEDTALLETFLPGRAQRPEQEINFWTVFPWVDIPGALNFKYTRELALPTVTPRGLNETITRTMASTEQITGSLKIYESEWIVDHAMLRTPAGVEAYVRQQVMHGKAIMQTVQNHIFKGDETSSAHQITGLQAQCTGDQLVSEGSTSGGDPLQIATLRDAIDRCYGDGPKVILCGKGLARRLDAAVGLAAVGASIREGQTMWGAKARTFDGIPIVPVADFDGSDNVLDFSEAGEGGGSTATSLYVVALGGNDVHGYRNGGLVSHEVAEASVEPARIGRLMMLPQLAIKRVSAAVRLYGISNAAVIA